MVASTAVIASKQDNLTSPRGAVAEKRAPGKLHAARCVGRADAPDLTPAYSAQMALPPLLHEGWIEFNRVKWGAEVLRVRVGADSGSVPRVDAVFFLNTKGRIHRTPLTPYASVLFTPSPTHACFRVMRQWLELGDSLAREMRLHGLAGPIPLPPEIVDVRPWQWLGFRSAVKYTFLLDLPYDISSADHNVRAKIRRAADAGCTCARTQHMRAVHASLLNTAAIQNFRFDLSVSDLELADSLMGPEAFRCYVSYAANGEPLSARVVLHSPGARALLWLAGTNGYTRSGATELLLDYLLRDLQTEGASGLDFVGANLPNIAAAKAKWGAKLVPFYTIEAFGLRQLARMWYGFLRSGLIRLTDL